VLKGQFNEVAEQFKERSCPFEIKYLRGILAVPPGSPLAYDPYYRPHYGEAVNCFPFHSVLFQHSGFGPSLRNYLALNAPRGLLNELVEEWREGVLEVADRYCERQGAEEDSD
jgi:hypothetical protein